MLPRPTRWRFGRSIPFTARARLPSVLLPTSPYCGGVGRFADPDAVQHDDRRATRHTSVSRYRRGNRPRSPVSTSYGTQAAASRDLGDVDAVVAVGADERRDVADLARHVGHVDHRHVHRDDAGDRRALPADENAAAIAERASIAVRVSDRERRDATVALGAKGAAVAHRVAVRNGAQVDDARAHRDDRIRLDHRRVAAAHAVQKNSRAARGPTATDLDARSPELFSA